MKFNSSTKVMAFSEDLIVLTKGACRMETENYSNQELKKIEKWTTDIKIEFIDKICMILFITWIRKDISYVNISLNYKSSVQI